MQGRNSGSLRGARIVSSVDAENKGPELAAACCDWNGGVKEQGAKMEVSGAGKTACASPVGHQL